MSGDLLIYQVLYLDYLSNAQNSAHSVEAALHLLCPLSSPAGDQGTCSLVLNLVSPTHPPEFHHRWLGFLSWDGLKWREPTSVEAEGRETQGE